MKTQKYRIEEEALLEYLNFKTHLREICLAIPIKDSEILDIAKKKIAEGDPGEDYYQQRHFLIMVRLLEEHDSFFYPESDKRIRMFGGGKDRIRVDDLPMSIEFSREDLMANANWVTDDILNGLLTYHYIQKDFTEEFWKMVLHAHDHLIYNLPWIEQSKEEIINTAGYDNIRDFMEDMGNPSYHEEKRLKETRKFIYNLI